MSILGAESMTRTDSDLEFDVKMLLQKCYEYYSDKQVDAQFLSHLTYLLQPCLAPGHPTVHNLKDKSLLPVIYMLTSGPQDPQAITKCLTSNLCHIDWAGVNTLHLEAVLTTYLDLLERHQSYNTATLMRKAGATLTSMAEENETLDTRSKIGLACGRCGKALGEGAARLRCDKCGAVQAPCGVCWQRRAPDPLPGKRSKKADAPPSGALLEFCMVCGHAAHPGCWDLVQRDPVYGGHCVVPECECACRPGPWRNRVVKEEEERNVRGVIRGEERKVGESRAVEGARKLLDTSGSKKTVAFIDGMTEVE